MSSHRTFVLILESGSTMKSCVEVIETRRRKLSVMQRHKHVDEEAHVKTSDGVTGECRARNTIWRFPDSFSRADDAEIEGITQGVQPFAIPLCKACFGTLLYTGCNRYSFALSRQFGWLLHSQE